MNASDTKFNHRINAGQDGKFFSLHDAINPSLERATAIADLIEVACEVVDVTSFESTTLWRAAQAIRLEIKDTQTILVACLDENKNSNQEVQS